MYAMLKWTLIPSTSALATTTKPNKDCFALFLFFFIKDVCVLGNDSDLSSADIHGYVEHVAAVEVERGGFDFLR